MLDIKKDNRVTTLTTHAGIRNSLLTILDQLQRCQKSLNEFLEVFFFKSLYNKLQSALISYLFEKISFFFFF